MNHTFVTVTIMGIAIPVYMFMRSISLIFVGMSIFLKNISFHGILLDSLFEDNNRDWEEVSDLLLKGINSGCVRPLRTTVFSGAQLEEGFRFMAQGKHIGKVLIQVSGILLLCELSAPPCSVVTSWRKASGSWLRGNISAKF